jgi:ribosomal protein L37AE/L43A
VSIHIHNPPKTWIRRVFVCPVCNERHRIVGMSQEWYDTIWTCCGCGDSWSDGWLLPHPFARGWREESKRRAKQQWLDAR